MFFLRRIACAFFGVGYIPLPLLSQTPTGLPHTACLLFDLAVALDSFLQFVFASSHQTLRFQIPFLIAVQFYFAHYAAFSPVSGANRTVGSFRAKNGRCE